MSGTMRRRRAEKKKARQTRKEEEEEEEMIEQREIAQPRKKKNSRKEKDGARREDPAEQVSTESSENTAGTEEIEMTEDDKLCSDAAVEKESETSEQPTPSEEESATSVKEDEDSEMGGTASTDKGVHKAESTQGDDVATLTVEKDVAESQKFVFDKIAILSQIEQAVNDSHQGPSDEKEKSKYEQMFEELHSLRTTEAEYLLTETRRLAKARAVTQENQIKLLHDELATCKDKYKNYETEKKALQEEVKLLKETNARLAKEISDGLEELVDVEKTKIPDKDTNDELEQAKKGLSDVTEKLKDSKAIIKALKLVTGLTVAVESAKLVCTLTNEKDDIFSYEITPTDDAFVFHPVQGLAHVAAPLRQDITFDNLEEFRLVQAQLQKSIAAK